MKYETATEWKLIEGFYYEYRIGDNGEVQRKLKNGTWKSLSPYFSSRNPKYARRLAVSLVIKPAVAKRVFVVDLMARYFLGGRQSGKVITHKNGSITDCAKWNLIFVTQYAIGKKYGGAGRRSVFKVDKSGEVVEVYKSVSEAAKKNFVSRKAILARCQNKIKDPYLLTGYNFQYEDVQYGKSKLPRNTRKV